MNEFVHDITRRHADRCLIRFLALETVQAIHAAYGLRFGPVPAFVQREPEALTLFCGSRRSTDAW